MHMAFKTSLGTTIGQKMNRKMFMWGFCKIKFTHCHGTVGRTLGNCVQLYYHCDNQNTDTLNTLKSCWCPSISESFSQPLAPGNFLSVSINFSCSWIPWERKKVWGMLALLSIIHADDCIGSWFLSICRFLSIHILLVLLWRTLINIEPSATLFNNMLFNTESLHQNPFLLDFLFPFLILSFFFSFPTLLFFCSNPYSTCVWCSVFPNFLKPRHKVSPKHICFGLYAWFNQHFMNSSTVWDLYHEQTIQARTEHGSWPWETQINWE